MKIPYKITSGIALGTLSLAIVSAFLPLPPPRHLLTWDPCMAWVNYDPMERLVLFLCFGTFLVLTAQGLRNRSGPRWLAIVGVLALVLGVASDWWRIAGGCYSTASLICSFTWFGAVAVMFLHHAIQPRAESQARLKDGRLRTLVYRGVLPAFVSMPVAWSILNQFTALTYAGHNPQFALTAIRTVQRYIGWAEIVLFPFAAAVSLRWLMTRSNAKGG
jgi:hypothetical protein